MPNKTVYLFLVFIIIYPYFYNKTQIAVIKTKYLNKKLPFTASITQRVAKAILIHSTIKINSHHRCAQGGEFI